MDEYNANDVAAACTQSSDCTDWSEDIITPSWFTAKTGITVSNPSTFQILPNPRAGIGNLSTLIRIGWLETSVENKEPSQISYILKFLPSTTSEYGSELPQIVISEYMFQREVFFYTTLKYELERIQSISSYILESFYAASHNVHDENSVLVFEDLTDSSGFLMSSFCEGLSEVHLEKALDFLSRFHFGGEMLHKTYSESSLTDKYPELKLSWQHFVPEKNSTEIFQEFKSLAWFSVGLIFVTEKILEGPHADLIRHDLLQLLPHAEPIIQLLRKSGYRHATIIHDDLWAHNFLCHSDGRIKVLDWQLLALTDSAYEFSSFLFSAFPMAQINQARITEILTRYYHKKVVLYQHCNSEISRTLPEFLEFFETFGLAYALVWYCMSADSIYQNRLYRPKLNKIFHFLWKCNVIDFILQKIN